MSGIGTHALSSQHLHKVVHNQKEAAIDNPQKVSQKKQQNRATQKQQVQAIHQAEQSFLTQT